MFDIKPQTLHYWYKNFISDYQRAIASEQWPVQQIATGDKRTGEPTEPPVYVFKKEHLGANMSIDDKAIGKDGFTIFSNNDTGK